MLTSLFLVADAGRIWLNLRQNPRYVSPLYRRFSFITLIFIYLVIIAGSVVRTTGSGMGCPDWPKCFGQMVPPSSAGQLPENYQEISREHRIEKIEKFCGFLELIGLGAVAKEIKADGDLLSEEEFSVSKAWTEYGNRLVGFIAGNLVLVLFIWTLLKYRSNRILLGISFLNLVLMAVEGWFGSIVVATNLVPWTITIHMLLALIIVGIQIKIYRIAAAKNYHLDIKPVFKWLFFLCISLTFVQIILGAQVRQEVDFLVKDMVDRASWVESLTGDFLFHRSFSWILLAGHLVLWWINRKFAYGIPTIKWMLVLILVEFITGFLFSHAGMPAALQPIHLLMASILLGLQFYSLGYLKKSATALRI
jgi:cytochrome c oxidase assembly protein subunit 15